MTVESYDLVVSLGTDHHHFDRLVGWVDAYLEDHPEVRCLVQHGFTAPPQRAEAVERMPRAELLDLYRQATIILVQGGPGSILDAREVGAIPLAVPRVSKLNEVVDDHQVEFSRVMEEHGEAIVVTSAEDLRQKLDAGFARPELYKGSVRLPGNEKAAENLSGFMESLEEQNPSFIKRAGQIVAGFRSR